MAGIGVAGLVLLPFLPVALVAWGAYRLWKPAGAADRTGSAMRGPIAAIVGGVLLAAIMWPALLAGSEPISVAAEPAADSTATTDISASPSHDETHPSESSAAPTDDAAAPGATTTDAGPGSASAMPGGEADGAVGQAGALVPVIGVSDGDTIRVRVDGVTERIRIIGIDTPELTSNECYAQQAASKMQSLVQSKTVRLAADPTQDDRDRYGRLLRHVSLEDGRLVAEVMLEGGYGREYTYAAAYEHQARYRAAQARAQASGLGLWGSGCAGARSTPVPAPPPARTAAPSAPAAPKPPVAQPAPTGSCTIKGNINNKGEKIYHVPGGRSYAETKIDVSKGERWFCSASEAVAAGWRAARG